VAHLKKGATAAELVGISSGILRVRKLPNRTILNDWHSADYPFEEAMKKLFSIGEQRGMTNAARDALNALMKSGKEPGQAQLF